jgi:hypothetical protein
MKTSARIKVPAMGRSMAAPRKIVLAVPARSKAAAAAAAPTVTGPSRVLQASGTRGQLSLLPRPGLPR